MTKVMGLNLICSVEISCLPDFRELTFNWTDTPAFVFRLGTNASCVCMVSFFQPLVVHVPCTCALVGGTYLDKLNSVSIKLNARNDFFVLMFVTDTLGSASSRTCAVDR